MLELAPVRGAGEVMDPRSGRIFANVSPEDAKRRGLVPIPEGQEAEVRGMNRHQRRKWAAQQKRQAKR